MILLYYIGDSASALFVSAFWTILGLILKSLRHTAPILFIILFLTILPTFGMTTPRTVTVNTQPFAAASNYKILSGAHTVSGVQTALVILVEFQDVHHTKTPDQIKAVALDQLNSYYAEVSYGKVSITAQVFGWYMAPHPMGYYGHDSQKAGDDDNLKQLGRDAIALLPSGQDVSSFNYLVIVHAGVDQAGDQSTVKSDEIWSECHCSVFPTYPDTTPVNAQGKSFANYAILSEFNGVGTFAHEWGHLFGLPDLYDADNEDSYVGYWSLMDNGNWCCPNDNQGTPSYIGGWGATLLGWITPSIADSHVLLSAFDLKPLESAQASAVLIPVSLTTYYFIEDRAKSGRDSSLPTSGVLIYFADEKLETGAGILKLINPETDKVFGPQEHTSVLNGAAFKQSDQFRDITHLVYVAFVGGTESVTTLFSTQPLTGSFILTSLQTSVSTLSGMFSDQVSLSGTLTQNGGPLSGQTVEVDIYDSSSGQWKKMASGTTDELGGINLGLTLDAGAGNYLGRIFYAGGKTGSVWYTSASTQFPLQIQRATMTLSISPPTIVFDQASVGVSTTGLHGEPLTAVLVTIYVNNVQAGVVRTDTNGKANLSLHFGPTDLGPYVITAKANAPNYEPAQTSGNTFVIAFWLIAIILGAVIVGVTGFVWNSRRHRSAR